ncbi:hypothetical protein SAMN05660686_04327 [Thalassobaculum litoreum DSM 18839]|uniref:Uncharacterized protein n=1 Tax=Thalassobaculum litoreum DSM 18839 TaxID=1123362 RepID=A0A8G2EWS2_9PROT|nr:hypothetical protein SAMN05660686_04327 [Thalassobaculum litoreum DSM 18839]
MTAPDHMSKVFENCLHQRGHPHMAALIGIHSLARTMPRDRLGESLDKGLGVECVRQPPNQHLAGRPVHDGYQVEEAALHRHIGHVGAPDVVGPLDPRAAQQMQQIRPSFMMPGSHAGLGTLIDRHQTHQPHQAADPLLVDWVVVGAQVPGHLLEAVERRLEELFVDPPHQRQVQRRLTARHAVEGRTRDRQQVALIGHAQLGMSSVNHPTPHFPVQGLSFRDKKSLATAHSPIFACSSLTVSSETSGAFGRPPRSKMSEAPSKRARFHWWIIVGCTLNWLARSAIVCSPFSASRTTRALKSDLYCLRFDISDLLSRRSADFTR